MTGCDNAGQRASRVQERRHERVQLAEAGCHTGRLYCSLAQPATPRNLTTASHVHTVRAKGLAVLLQQVHLGVRP